MKPQPDASKRTSIAVGRIERKANKVRARVEVRMQDGCSKYQSIFMITGTSEAIQGEIRRSHELAGNTGFGGLA